MIRLNDSLKMSFEAHKEVSNTLWQPYNSWLAGVLAAAASIAQCQFDRWRDLAPSTAHTKKCTPFFLEKCNKKGCASLSGLVLRHDGQCTWIFNFKLLSFYFYPGSCFMYLTYLLDFFLTRFCFLFLWLWLETVGICRRFEKYCRLSLP